MAYTKISSPIGTLHLTANEEGLTELSFNTKGRAGSSKKIGKKEGVILNKAKKELQHYFQGDTKALSRIPISLGGTPFQKKVWQAMRKVTTGKTISYRDLGKKVGSPRASRAVGNACRINPLCLVVPCHRVITSDGRIGNFSGGVSKKQHLLKHEGVRF